MSELAALAALALLLLLGGCRHVSFDRGGLPLELARARESRVADLDYELGFDLRRALEGEVTGTLALGFALRGRGPLVLDFAGRLLEAPVLNGSVLPAGRARGRIELPADRLRPGARNTLRVRFASAVRATGTPLTIYRERATGAAYLYTLLVPADAHRLFPCFDQPSLRGRFRLELLVPKGHRAVANAPLAGAETLAGGAQRLRFARTAALPTYLFAFASGPFAVVEGAGGAPSIYVRPKARPHLDAARVARLHRRALAFFTRFFGRPYPFAKLDVVLVPGFPYHGMEHAGAIFYRENAVAFDRPPDELDLVALSTLVYHELAHQWFGNLVTMRWFDDLWLKEGFATFASYAALAELEPQRRAWLRFHERCVPEALRVDRSPGTRPIWQPLADLADAKSNYGPIVYKKAPAVLRELDARIGRPAMRRALALFLERHAFSAADRDDFVQAAAEASGTDLDAWARAWLLAEGCPRVEYEFDAEGITIRQSDPQGRGRSWPLSFSVLAQREDGSFEKLAVELTGESWRGGAGGRLRWLVADPGGRAYALFTPGRRAARALVAALGRFPDPLVEAVALTQAVNALGRTLPSPALADRLLDVLPEVEDPPAFARRLAVLVKLCRGRLRGTPGRARLARLETLLRSGLERGAFGGRAQAALRALARIARSEPSLALIEAILDGRLPPGLPAPGMRDRAQLLAALLAARRPGARERLARLQASAEPGAARAAWLASCALPDAAVKAERFAAFLAEDGPPEQWVQAALPFFLTAGQEELTFPYLRRALEAAPWVKRHRKIFFLPAWLEAFVGAFPEERALATVEDFLAAHPDLDPDIARKLAVPLFDLRAILAERRRLNRR